MTDRAAGWTTRNCGGSGGGDQRGVRVSVQLAQLAAHALVALAQLALERRQLRLAGADELELAFDVPERLGKQLAAALGVDVVAA